MPNPPPWRHKRGAEPGSARAVCPAAPTPRFPLLCCRPALRGIVSPSTGAGCAATSLRRPRGIGYARCSGLGHALLPEAFILLLVLHAAAWHLAPSQNLQLGSEAVVSGAAASGRRHE